MFSHKDFRVLSSDWVQEEAGLHLISVCTKRQTVNTEGQLQPEHVTARHRIM